MRHIVFDTESTGFYAEKDDRLVEIGALEVVNYVPTGRVFHAYINPERPIPAEATAVHGITDEQVQNKPIFSQIVEEFQEFIGAETPLVAHNADFDMRFINAEFQRCGFHPLPKTRFIDTLAIARRLFPGAPNSLDALCKRYNIDLSERTYHGALLDARLLADVFLELAGGRQPEFLQAGQGAARDAISQATVIDDSDTRRVWPARVFPLSAEEQEKHDKLVAGIKEALWAKQA